jgi:hypothetical protein
MFRTELTDLGMGLSIQIRLNALCERMKIGAIGIIGGT